ncbi:hypothetical protein U9M48_020737 [Paspalum notatum var. saurae]|uniref:Secreted protein n=1 Tax=Paspalum notatum var. saurae TaxID=547442 RepID=A0AAQ3TFM9_PASNO
MLGTHHCGLVRLCGVLLSLDLPTCSVPGREGIGLHMQCHAPLLSCCDCPLIYNNGRNLVLCVIETIRLCAIT